MAPTKLSLPNFHHSPMVFVRARTAQEIVMDGLLGKTLPPPIETLNCGKGEGSVCEDICAQGDYLLEYETDLV